MEHLIRSTDREPTDMSSNYYRRQKDLPDIEKNNRGTKHIHPCCENNFKLVVTEHTMTKVQMAFWMVGISFEDASMVIDQMQNSGILFREEAKP